MAGNKDGDMKFDMNFDTPLLFTLPQDQPADFRTPPAHSPLRESAGTISSARRSATPPGSVHTDTTPPRPPPILRLQDTLMSDAEPAGGTPPGMAGGPGALADPGMMLRAEQQHHHNQQQQQQSEDAWVTVYGFSSDDLPLVLREFQRCGDILQWGTFGASAQSNYIHIQYQNKYGAQRALQRSGEQLSSSLIVGVKQLDARHRALVQAWGSGAADGSPGLRVKAATGPARPYRVELPQAQVLPQRSRGWFEKVGQYVLGL